MEENDKDANDALGISVDRQGPKKIKTLLIKYLWGGKRKTKAKWYLLTKSRLITAAAIVRFLL